MAIDVLNIDKWIIARVKEMAPTVDTSEGSAIRDQLIDPLIPILRPLAQEIYRIRQSQSMQNSDKMTGADLDAVLANLFVGRKIGAKARGSVKAILREAQTTTVPSGTIFTSTQGYKFYSTSSVTATSAQIMAAGETYYYMEVNVIAAAEGSGYNIEKEEISSIITNNSNIVGARNDYGFWGGRARESNPELIIRAYEAVSQRDLSVRGGAKTILPAQFESIQSMDVVGHGDDKMIRDVITGNNLVFSGISIPDASLGAHCGSMADFHVKVGYLNYAADIYNPQSSGNPSNTISLFTAENDPKGSAQEDTIYESEDCFDIQKPIISIDRVARINALGDEVQELSEGKDFLIYVDNPAFSLSMQDNRSIKFYRGTGRISSITHRAMAPISDLDDVICLARMNDYIVPGYIKNEGRGADISVVDGMPAIDYATSFDGAGSLRFEGAATAPVAFDDSSDNSVGRLLRGASEFTIAFWIKPSSLITNYKNKDDGYYDQALICLGQCGSGGTHIKDDHVISAYLQYDSATDRAGLKVVLATDGLDFPTESVSESFIDSDDIGRWIFVAITYKEQGAYGGKLKAYVQSQSGGLHISGLPYNILNQYSPFSVAGKVKSSWSSTLGYIGRAHEDSIVNRTTGSESPPLFHFHGHFDELIIEPVALSEDKIVRLFKESSSSDIRLSSQTIYKGDGTGALDPTMMTGFSEGSLNGIRMQVATGKAHGGVYKVVRSSLAYVGTTPVVDVSLIFDPTQPKLEYLHLSDVLGVAPVYPGADEMLTDLSGGLVYDEYILDPDDGSHKIDYDKKEDGDIVPIGSSIHLEYKSSTDISEIQDYVNSDLNRSLTTSNLVKYLNPVSITLSAVVTQSPADSSTLQSKIDGVTSFIESMQANNYLEVSAIISKLFDLGCSYVKQPITLSAIYRDAEGKLFSETVTDKFLLPGGHIFICDSVDLEYS